MNNRTINHQRNVAISLLRLGDALRHLQQLDRALTYLQQILDILTTTGDGTVRGMVLQFLAQVYHEQGRTEDALNHLNCVIEIHRAEHWSLALGEALSELGAILSEIGSPDQARAAWREALTILADLDPHLSVQISSRLDSLPAP